MDLFTSKDNLDFKDYIYALTGEAPASAPLVDEASTQCRG